MAQLLSGLVLGVGMIEHKKENCKNRSSMNGCCLLCNHEKANKMNRNEKSLYQHALDSLKIGVKDDDNF